MWTNRSVQMKIIKDAPEPTPEPIKPSVKYDEILETVLIGTAAIVGGYILADTVRQVAIHAAKTYMK